MSYGTPAPAGVEVVAARRTGWAEAASTLRLAVPLMAAQVSVVALGLIDTATFGVLGTAALAGGGLGASVFGFVNITAVGVMTATSIQVAYAAAAHRHALPDIMRAGLLVALLLGALAGIGLASSGPLLLRLGQHPDIVANASRYLAAAALSLIPNLVFTALRGLTVGLGRPGPVTAITAAAVVVKGLLNLGILLIVQRAGAADRASLGLILAGAVDTLTYGLMAAALFVHCRRRLPGVVRLPRLATLRSPALGEAIRLGVPIGLSYAVETALFTGAGLIVGRFGANALAAHAIALQCAALTFMLAVGLSQAATVRVGQAWGAGRVRDARRVGRQAIGIGLLVMTFSVVLFAMFGHAIASLLVGDGAGSAEVVALTTQLLAVAACFQWFDGTQNIAIGALRGLKHTRVSLIAAIVGYWAVGLPAAWLLGRTALGPVGVWWGLVLGLATTATILVATFEIATRPRRDPAGDEPA